MRGGFAARGILLTAFLAALPLAHAPAFAQGLGLSQDPERPVEINADQGIEWRRDDQVYIARGNATAKRGDITVRADTLTAHYRPVEGGGTDIYRLDAVGGVVITSPSSKAVGDNGVYDVDNAILVLKGGALKMISQDYTVTARDSLEYWDRRQMAVARGDALVVNQDKRLSADIVTAFFTDDTQLGEPGGKTQTAKRAAKKEAKNQGQDAAGADQNQIRRIEGFTNVHISTPGQIATGDRGVYDVESGIATLFGSVKITREDNQLNGEYGEVNLDTGVSRMLSGPPGATGPQPVRGLFSPKKKPQISPREGPDTGPAAGPVAAPAPPAAAGYVPTQAPPPAP
jgi:lipopolysaccharide export system protein LptA